MLHHRFLDVILLFLLLTLLVSQLLLEHFHLLAVLFLNGLRLSRVLTCGRHSLSLVLLHFAHLGLDLLDSLRPRVLEQLAQITLNLVDVLLDGGEELLFFFKACRTTGLSVGLLCDCLIALQS